MGIIIFSFFGGGGWLLCVFMILPGISWVHLPECECLETLLSAHRGECDAHARVCGEFVGASCLQCVERDSAPPHLPPQQREGRSGYEG